MEKSSVWVIPFCGDWQKSRADEVLSFFEAFNGSLPLTGLASETVFWILCPPPFFFFFKLNYCSLPKMFWNIIPRCVLFIADLHVLPSRALLRSSPLLIFVFFCPHFLGIASKSSGFKESQPSVTFMSCKLREG